MFPVFDVQYVPFICSRKYAVLQIRKRKLTRFMQIFFEDNIIKFCRISNDLISYSTNITGDPLHSRAACTQPCNVNTHNRAHCSYGARLCEQWGHGCVNNGARLCASARLCRGSPVNIHLPEIQFWTLENIFREKMNRHLVIFLNHMTPGYRTKLS